MSDNKKILDFNTNSNPFGPPKGLEQYLAHSLQDAIIYPDYKNIDVNNAIAEFLDCPVKNIAVANGSLEAIYAIPKLVDSSRPSIVFPTFWGYKAALDLLSIKFDKIFLKENKNFETDIHELNDKASRSTLLFICNPNNPTGTYIQKKDLLKIVRQNPNCHFFIDECHLIFKDIYLQETLSKYVNKLSNLTIIYSTSKIFNAGGLRTGIITSNEKIIEAFRKFQIPYSTTTITQKAFIQMLKNKEFIEYMKSHLGPTTRHFSEQLKTIPWLKVMETQTHFILCKITTKSITAIQLALRLKEDGFAIRECTTSYAELNGEWVRITSNTEANNKKLVSMLRSYNLK